MSCRKCDSGMEFRLYAVCINGEINSVVKITDGCVLLTLLQEYFHSAKTDNSSVDRVEELKYLGTTLIDQNSIQEEIKSKLKLGNACYHSVQNLLSSRLLSKSLKIKIYRTIILLLVLYGCETWSLTLREERRLRVSENRMLRRVFGPKRDEVTGEWRKLNDLYSLPNIVGSSELSVG